MCKAIIEAPRSAERRHGLREIVVGENLDSVADIERLWEKMYHQTNRYGRRGAAVHTISGVDLALYDLLGKHLGKPVYELLGGLKRPRIRVYMSVLFEDTPEETAALASKAKQLGFTAVKFGWGPFGVDPATDVAHVAAAREALGEEIDLGVDAGCKWDATTAVERAELLKPFHLMWLEEPLSQDDAAGYVELCSKTSMPIACGEGECTVRGRSRLYASCWWCAYLLTSGWGCRCLSLNACTRLDWRSCNPTSQCAEGSRYARRSRSCWRRRSASAQRCHTASPPASTYSRACTGRRRLTLRCASTAWRIRH